MINASLTFLQLQNAAVDLGISQRVVTQRQSYYDQILKIHRDGVEMGTHTAGSLEDYLVVVQSSASQVDLKILEDLQRQVVANSGEYVLMVSEEKIPERDLISQQFNLGVLNGASLAFDVRNHSLTFPTTRLIARACGIEPSWASDVSQFNMQLPNARFSELRKTLESTEGVQEVGYPMLLQIVIGTAAVKEWFMSRGTSNQRLLYELEALLLE